MRILLLLVVLFNALGALGSVIVAFTDEQASENFITNMGRAFDAAIIEVSIVVIALAILRFYPKPER